LPPRSVGRVEDFFTKFLEFFNADGSNRFRDGFPPLVIDSFNALEFFKWHGTPSLDGFQWVRTEWIIFDAVKLGKERAA
jgi:hypothetical protein